MQFVMDKTNVQAWVVVNTETKAVEMKIHALYTKNGVCYTDIHCYNTSFTKGGNESYHEQVKAGGSGYSKFDACLASHSEDKGFSFYGYKFNDSEGINGLSRFIQEKKLPFILLQAI